MSITIVCVGKLKEKHFKDACNEYQKRLTRLMPTQVIEVPDESEPDKASPKLIEKIKQIEGERLLNKIPPKAYVIAMAINGKRMDSTNLASFIKDLFIQGKSNIYFVIGGSVGLSDEVLSRANEKLTLSSLTFPHALARVILLEQLFRVGKINAGESYHK